MMIPVSPNMHLASARGCSQVDLTNNTAIQRLRSHSPSGYLHQPLGAPPDFTQSCDTASFDYRHHHHPYPHYRHFHLSHKVTPLSFEPTDSRYHFRAFTSHLRFNHDDDLTQSLDIAAAPARAPASSSRSVLNWSSSDAEGEKFSDLLASVQVVPKSSGQGYDLYRSRAPSQQQQQQQQDDVTFWPGYSQQTDKKVIKSPRNNHGRSPGHNLDFTQSAAVGNITQFSRNIANPALREKQKSRLELATSKMDLYRTNDSSQNPISADKSGNLPDSRRIFSASNPSKRIPPNYVSGSSRRHDLALKDEIFVSDSIGYSDMASQASMKLRPSREVNGSPSRRLVPYNYFPDSKMEVYKPGNANSSNVEKGITTAPNKEMLSSMSVIGRESDSKANRRKSDTCSGTDTHDFECSCSLYHSHQIPGRPVNTFLTEVKERRAEKLMASLKLVEEGPVDNVDDPRYIFWVPNLSFHPYVHGDQKLVFGKLWPRHRELRDLLQNPGIQQQLQRDDAVLALCTLAVTCGPLHLLQCLIDWGLIRVDQQTECGSGLLHLAVLARNAESVKYLMAAKVSPKIRDRQGLTADQVCFSPHVRKQLLPRYIQSRDVSKDKILLKPSLQDKDTIFKLATSPQYFADIQKKLQTFDFNINTECDNNGDFLLHIACRSGLSQLPLLMALVKIQGADIELCNVNGMTPLMMAAADGNCVLCDVLICLFGADPNKTNSSSGKSALHYAVEGNHRKTVECLIRRGADVNIEDFDGLRPDDLPGCYTEVDDCCEVIIFHRSRRLEMLSDIVKKGQVVASQLHPSDMCVVDADKHTLIMMAAIYNRSDTLETLLSVSRATINAQHCRTGMTALAIAAQMGNSSAVGTLLKHHANPAIADMKGFFPLHHAVLNNHELTVETILQYFPQTYMGLLQSCRLCKKTSIHTLLNQARDRRQQEIVTPKLLGCALNGDAGELYLLLDEGDNINPNSGTGNWPLYLAVENGHLDVLKLIVERGGDFLKRHPTTGATALHLAARMGQESIVSYLLQYCANSSHQNKKAMITQSASSMLLSSFLSSHLKSSSQPDQVSSAESSKSSHQPHREGKKLLYINAVDGDNKTALQVAAEKGFSRIVEMLLQHGASTAILDSYGNLVSCSQYEGVRIMIESHRHQHSKEVFGCLMDKSRNARKSLAMLESIWLPKFDHHLRNKEGSTPLMLACLLGRIPVIKFLLQSAVYNTLNDVEDDENDSDADSGVLDPSTGSPKCKDDFTLSQSMDQADLQDTKPKITVTQETQAQSQLLMNSTEFFNQRRLDRIIMDANRPKGLAIYHSGVTSHVCAVNLQDGTTALHQALLGSDAHQILSLLLEADSGPLNIQDDKGETALHLACRLNRKKSVEFLLAQRGIDLNVRTLNGQLPEELSFQKSIQKMVEKAREFCPAYVSSKDSPPLSPSPALSGRSQSVIASTVNFDRLHDRYEELKRDKNAPLVHNLSATSLETSS